MNDSDSTETSEMNSATSYRKGLQYLFSELQSQSNRLMLQSLRKFHSVSKYQYDSTLAQSSSVNFKCRVTLIGSLINPMNCFRIYHTRSGFDGQVYLFMPTECITSTSTSSSSLTSTTFPGKVGFGTLREPIARSFHDRTLHRSPFPHPELYSTALQQ